MKISIDRRFRAKSDLWIGLPSGLILAFLICGSVVVQPPANCFAQPASKMKGERPFRENVTLPFDTNLLKRFGTVEDLLANQRWNESIAILQEIAQTESQSLVLVQPGKAGGVATYLNANTRCNVLLSRIPAEGRSIYRQKFDAQAKRWFENWQRTRDQTELLKIVRQTYLSSHTDDALVALGEVAWDTGDFALARQWWEQLIPLPNEADPAKYPTVLRYPDAQVDRPTTLARILSCSILERDWNRAADELQQFNQQYPAAEGWLAGQKGCLADILWKTLDDAKQWKAPRSGSQFSTFAASPEREFRSSETLDAGAEMWVRPLPANPITQRLGRFPLPIDPLCYFPVTFESTFDRIVLVNDANSIRAWNLINGEPAWPSEGKDPAAIYPSIADLPISLPDQACTGIPQYTMTIANNKLYARMGTPVTSTSIGELRLSSDSEIVCLDLLQQGKLAWKVTARELVPEDNAWQFEGTPVVIAGRAYVVLCRRNPQLELTVLCLDASDGRLLWNRAIGAFRASVDEAKNRISHLLLTAGANRLFLSTDVGVILAIDSVDGRLEWAISYERRNDENAAKFDLNPRGTTPPLYHGGVLYVAPTDATGAYCIEADSGRVRWNFRYLDNHPDGLNEGLRRESDFRLMRAREWKQLLGVVPGGSAGRLVVSGNALWWIDISTGRIVLSQHEGSSMGNAKEAFGRGLIAGNQVFFPTRESIEVFDAKMAEPVRSIQLKTPDRDRQGGNLAIAGGQLLIAQSNRLSAHGEFSRLKERSEKDLTLHPDDPEPVLRLAQFDLESGDVEPIAERIRTIMDRLDSDDPTRAQLQNRLATLFKKAGANDFQATNLIGARSHWTKALDNVRDASERVDLIVKLARVDEGLNETKAAVLKWHKLLIDDRLNSEIRDGSSIATIATREISRLVAERGRECYSEVEILAASSLDLLSVRSDLQDLRTFIAAYPHSISKDRIQNLLVDSYRKRAEPLEACAVLDDIRSREQDDHAYIEKTLSLIASLESIGATNTAEGLWRSLATRDVSMEVRFGGKTCDLIQLAQSKLQGYSDLVRSTPEFLERFWKQTLPRNSQVIVPLRTPPSDDLAVVLICFPQDDDPKGWVWQCVDWKTGKLRWKDLRTDPIQNAVWSRYRLLIGTSRGWQSRTAEKLRLVWEAPFEGASEPLTVRQSNVRDGDLLWPAMFDVERGLRFFDPSDGRLVAQLKPPGPLNRSLAVRNVGSRKEGNSPPNSTSEDTQSLNPSRGDSSIVVAMQTDKPPQIWKAVARSPHDEWKFELLSPESTAWNANPTVIQHHLIGVTQDFQLVGYTLDRADIEASESKRLKHRESLLKPNRWLYNNFAFSFKPPVTVPVQNELLVIVNGSNLASFDPKSGVRKWESSLAQYPIDEPAKQFCIHNDVIFVASLGVLRAVSIKDGSVRFERYLGSSNKQWKLSAMNRLSATEESAEVPLVGTRTLIAVWPLEKDQDRDRAVLLCDSETGAIVQRMNVDSEPTDFVVSKSGFGFVATTKSVSGLKTVSSN